MNLMFDCDDTLYDLSWPFRMAIDEVIPEAKMLDLDNLYRDYRKFGDDIFDKIQAGTMTTDESGVIRIKMACNKYGIFKSDSIYEKFQSVYKQYQGHICMDEGFKELFQDTNHTYAILTNGDDKHQRFKLSVLGVFDYIPQSNIFTSGQLNHAKPDPLAFQLCLDQMHAKAEDWYYVGDNYINDIEGAKSVGMKTIHFNRHHQMSGPCADHVVYSACELFRLIRKLKAF